MRPKITCHMITSLDGRLLPERWSDPADGSIEDLIVRHYDATAERLHAGGWIVGRKTMASYVAEDRASELSSSPKARPPHFAKRGDRDLAVAIDPSGRLHYASDNVEGDHVVAVLSERVSDAYLAHLEENGVSYVFAGAEGDQVGVALETVGAEFGIHHLILEGGGRTNGAFLAAGLIDEVSTLICPTIDGLSGIPTIFEAYGPPGSHPAANLHLRLSDCEILEGGVVWLRHDVVRA